MPTYPKKHGVAEAVLQAIAGYAKSDIEDAEVIMTHALGNALHCKMDDTTIRQIMWEYIAIMTHAAAAGVPISYFHDAVKTWNGTQIPQPAIATPVLVMGNVSPHSRNKPRQPKPDFWIKAITSFDPNVKNGYGLKGKFVNPDEVTGLAKDTLLVAQLTERRLKNKMIYIMRVRDRGGAKSSFIYPQNVKPPIEIPDVDDVRSYNNYDDLYRALGQIGVPHTQ